MGTDEEELQRCVRRVLDSPSKRKLVVAGPVTGKTTLFKQLLQGCAGDADDRLVLTFISTLRDDLDTSLANLAQVRTLHSYCMGLLHSKAELRTGLSPEFRCIPGLAHLIAADWEHIHETEAPRFVGQMRNLTDDNELSFYIARGNYYDAVDFDDSVFRAQQGLAANPQHVDPFALLLIDEYQDFNALEAGLIEALSARSPILIAGDDDQALYSQLRDSTWDYIRALRKQGDFDVFELPFCMRCPKVIVDAVNDVFTQAKRRKSLSGRIEKPYKHFPPAKGADSQQYPTIALVNTSVQRANGNYMGMYVADLISRIPPEEVQAAREGNYPALLVIVAKPYRTQIVNYLLAQGYTVETKRDADRKLERAEGLAILKADRRANVGWRIVLQSEHATLRADVISRSAKMDKRVDELVSAPVRDRIEAEVEAWEPQGVDPEAPPAANTDQPVVRVTSFEGAKGLSAQHVVIAGMHNGEIPHDYQNIADIEICRFLVGLTRTRKRCYLLYTDRFAQTRKYPSAFLSWIAKDRFQFVRIDAKYWKNTKS